MAVFFTACYLTFPHSVDTIYHEYEI